MCLLTELGLNVTDYPLDPAALPAYPCPSGALVLDQMPLCKLKRKCGAKHERKLYSQR